ncbi:hypothetical protein GCM10010231_07320 [Streptomyces sindenensis]|nr:hypothetical protein GCM10010231_07320 [Streptomyces sindenensis]
MGPVGRPCATGAPAAVSVPATAAAETERSKALRVQFVMDSAWPVDGPPPIREPGARRVGTPPGRLPGRAPGPHPSRVLPHRRAGRRPEPSRAGAARRARVTRSGSGHPGPVMRDTVGGGNPTAF